jgi:hypothetical protein
MGLVRDPNVATSGSIPTPNAMDMRINAIEMVTAQTMNLRFDGSERWFALLCAGKFFIVVMTSLYMDFLREMLTKRYDSLRNK